RGRMATTRRIVSTFTRSFGIERTAVYPNNAGPPARRSCSTHTACATAVGCESRHVGLPQPVLQPATSITSLTAKHNPSSEPLPVGGRSSVVAKALLSLTVIVDFFIPG